MQYAVRRALGVVLALSVPVAGSVAEESSTPPSPGYLVVSIGPSSTMDTISLFAEYKSDDGQIDNRAYWSGMSPFPNDYNSPGGDRGFVFVWSLPAGRYHFYRIEEEDVGDYVYTWRFTLPFAIAPGRTTYAGDLKFVAQQGRGFLGMPIAKGGYVAVSNESNRDIAIAASKAKFNLAELPVDILKMDVDVLQRPPFCMSEKREIPTPGPDVPLCPKSEPIAQSP